MVRREVEDRPFVPGTTGWTASDLDDPEIERQWFAGHYEIIEGVLTTMPPAYYAGHGSLGNLIFCLQQHLKSKRRPTAFGQDIDMVMAEGRVVRADAMYLTKDDKQAQAKAARRLHRRDVNRTRILVPPTLIIESISPGHEQHDESTKRRWYAEFGVPNYWLLNGFDRTLRCLKLHRGAYQLDATGRGKGRLRPSLFSGLVISLTDVWESIEAAE
jgi:Uma2 family endonuclease